MAFHYTMFHWLGGMSFPHLEGNGKVGHKSTEYPETERWITQKMNWAEESMILSPNGPKLP